jgi:hypothetical protein
MRVECSCQQVGAYSLHLRCITGQWLSLEQDQSRGGRYPCIGCANTTTYTCIRSPPAPSCVTAWKNGYATTTTSAATPLLTTAPRMRFTADCLTHSQRLPDVSPKRNQTTQSLSHPSGCPNNGVHRRPRYLQGSQTYSRSGSGCPEGASVHKTFRVSNAPLHPEALWGGLCEIDGSFFRPKMQ